MMNKVSRRLSKIPEEVRGEIEPHFMDSDPVVAEDSRKLVKLDDCTAQYVRKGLTVTTGCPISFFSIVVAVSICKLPI